MNHVINKWYTSTEQIICIHGVYGSGKTYTVQNYCKSKNIQVLFFYPDMIKSLHLINNISIIQPIAVLDECECFEKDVDFIFFLNQMKKIYKKIVILGETNYILSRQFLESETQIVPLKKICYTNYKKLVKGSFKTKHYYDNIFKGDIRQLILQSSMSTEHVPDSFLSLNKQLEALNNGIKVNVSDVSLTNNIIVESYLSAPNPVYISNRLIYSIYNFKLFDLNLYMKCFYPMYGQRSSSWTWITQKLQWTRISNIKYRKKNIQDIIRNIKKQFIEIQSLEKIIILRKSVLEFIKLKQYENAYQIFQSIGLHHSFINYLPKLQYNDEFFSFVSRLKPFYSFVRNQ